MSEEAARPKNIIARGLAFLQWLIILSQRRAWDSMPSSSIGLREDRRWRGFRAVRSLGVCIHLYDGLAASRRKNTIKTASGPTTRRSNFWRRWESLTRRVDTGRGVLLGELPLSRAGACSEALRSVCGTHSRLCSARPPNRGRGRPAADR